MLLRASEERYADSEAEAEHARLAAQRRAEDEDEDFAHYLGDESRTVCKTQAALRRAVKQEESPMLKKQQESMDKKSVVSAKTPRAQRTRL